MSNQAAASIAVRKKSLENRPSSSRWKRTWRLKAINVDIADRPIDVLVAGSRWQVASIASTGRLAVSDGAVSEADWSLSVQQAAIDGRTLGSVLLAVRNQPPAGESSAQPPLTVTMTGAGDGWRLEELRASLPATIERWYEGQKIYESGRLVRRIEYVREMEIVSQAGSEVQVRLQFDAEPLFLDRRRVWDSIRTVRIFQVRRDGDGYTVVSMQ